LVKLTIKGEIMTKPIEEMSYKEFDDYCNERACDGRWGFEEAIACCGMIREIEESVKGKLFKRKAREKAWENLKVKYSY
jgi:hypothetical protein